MWRERLLQVVYLSRTVFKWSWIPLILYFGLSKGGDLTSGLPEPTLFSSLSIL